MFTVVLAVLGAFALIAGIASWIPSRTSDYELYGDRVFDKFYP